ncbi:hypothetical protein Scep_012477 [Stephania cephalantha]|uniref:Uncharacterized protein n=1 Tax=Stephania cephalantha TaxID=152367 RepID=A0AAP0JF91_9MAGN
MMRINEVTQHSDTLYHTMPQSREDYPQDSHCTVSQKFAHIRAFLPSLQQHLVSSIH